MQSNALDKVKEAYEILLQREADEAAGVAGTTDKPEAKSASETLFAARMLLQEALRCYEPKEQERMRNLSFAEAMEHFKKGRLIRRAGDRLWYWLGKKSGSIYYGFKRDCPLLFKDTWLTSEIFSEDWEVQEEGGADNGN